MKCSKIKYTLIIGFAMILTLLSAKVLNKTASISAVASLSEKNTCIVIDAGHGGVDGGAISCTGVLESSINLQIALKLEEILHLIGYRTIMIRREDISVYTDGDTIAQKKVSDLKERLRIIQSTPNALLVSVHQNSFPDSKYSGAQVFYANTPGSKELAQLLQNNLCRFDKQNKRMEKASTGVYLMSNITCTGILIECGFLSNPIEESKLRDPVYQNKLCTVVASSIALFLDRRIIS